MLCFPLIFSHITFGALRQIVGKGNVFDLKCTAVEILQAAGIGLESEDQLVGVEGLVLEREIFVVFVEAVFGITGQRMAEVSHLGTDLMGAAGMQTALDQRQAMGRLEDLIIGNGG